MKVEHTIEYLMRIKGFRHGAANYPRDPIHYEDPDYWQGYEDGMKAWCEYIASTRKFLADNQPRPQ